MKYLIKTEEINVAGNGFSLSILDCRCTIEFHAQCFSDEWNKWIDRRKPVSHYNQPLAMDMNTLGVFFRFKIIYLVCVFFTVLSQLSGRQYAFWSVRNDQCVFHHFVMASNITRRFRFHLYYNNSHLSSKRHYRNGVSHNII